MLSAKRFHHQRGGQVLARGQLALQYEGGGRESGMTALGGLPLYLDWARVMGIGGAIEGDLRVGGGGPGWSEAQVGMALILHS